MREYVSKCFVDYAAYPNEEWDLSREEAIYLCRDSRAGLDSLTQIPLSQKNLRRFCSLRPSPWGGGRSGVSCCSSQFYISKRFFFARVINWTIIILQYAHTHRQIIKMTSWRSRLAFCGEVVNNSAKGCHS